MRHWLIHTPNISSFNWPQPDVIPPLEKLNQWVKIRESQLTDIRDGCHAHIHWHGKPDKTDIALVFVHGFSASRQECDPFVSRIAHALKANIFFARLRGHGRTPEAMCDGSLKKWLSDTAQACVIGQRLGRRTILIGCSTGAALLTLSMALYPVQADLMCLISPSFANANRATRLLEYRGRRILLRLMLGKNRSWKSDDPMVKTIWSNSYPSTAILPYIDTMRLLRKTALHSIVSPTLTFAAPKDTLVSYQSTRQRLLEFSGHTELHPIYNANDPLQHNIIGSVLSPDTLEECTEVFLRFADRKL